MTVWSLWEPEETQMCYHHDAKDLTTGVNTHIHDEGKILTLNGSLHGPAAFPCTKPEGSSGAKMEQSAAKYVLPNVLTVNGRCSRGLLCTTELSQVPLLPVVRQIQIKRILLTVTELH